MNTDVVLKVLETSAEMEQAEELQRRVWTGNETEVVPVHMLIAVVHNGGVAIGAYTTGEEPQRLVGFVFGFPAFEETPDGLRLKHHSHMLGVDPAYRDGGLGFRLKRAQWQMVRQQGVERITWTYDPLLSRNAHLNITRLGAVCSTYLRDVYGELRDGMNAGLPSDRFMVDWWVNSNRVRHRLGSEARKPLDLAHYLAGGAQVINPTRLDERGLACPVHSDLWLPDGDLPDPQDAPILLVEIPAAFTALKDADPALGLAWRMHAREIFESLFQRGYIVTDLIHLPGSSPRSFYALSHGDSTL